MLTRVDFLGTDFTDLITQKGYSVLIENNIKCPCVDPDTLRTVPDCVGCDGRGNYYYTSYNTKGMISRMNKESQKGDPIGLLEPGYAYITLPQGSQLTMNDRVTNLDSTVIYSEVMLHSDVDQTRYNSVGRIVFAGIQASKLAPLQPLVQDVDFTIGHNGILSYSPALAAQLSSGQGISIRYYCNPVWIVKDNGNFIRDTFVTFQQPSDLFTNLPVRALMKLEFMGES